MTKNYLPEDKKCAHCGGNLSPHSLGEFGGIKIWCDDCGSNSPESPPSVEMTNDVFGDDGNVYQTTISNTTMTKQTDITLQEFFDEVDKMDAPDVPDEHNPFRVQTKQTSTMKYRITFFTDGKKVHEETFATKEEMDRRVAEIEGKPKQTDWKCDHCKFMNPKQENT